MKHKYRILSALLPLFVAIGVLGLSSAAEATAPVTTWDALQTAVEQATGETTIHIQGTLEKDNQDTVITVPKDVHITLVGDKTADAAAAIIRPSQSTVGEFVVPEGAALTLKGDIAIAGSEDGTVPKDLSYAHFIQVAKGGRLQIEGAVTASTKGSLNNQTPLGLIVCEGTATLSDGAALSGWLNPLSSGNFDDESAALVIKGKDASLTMNGGEIFNNNATASNGLAPSAAVQIRDGAAFTMNRGSIHDNNVGKQGCGGGIIVTGAESTFTMTGGDIRANQGRYGAGVYIEGQAADANAGTNNIPATFTMTGGTFSENALNNTAKSKGGGLYAENSTVTIDTAPDATAAPTFVGNTTNPFPAGMWNPFQSDGAAIYCINSTLTMNGAKVIDTKSESTNSHGGAVHLDNTKATLAHTTLANNQCGTNNMAFAGALYITGASEVTMDHMTITDNTSVPESEYTNGGAGAILISGDENKSAKVTITNSDISNNMTGGANAGAIYAEGATLSIADTSINGNTVKTPDGQKISSWFRYNGGALYLAGSTVALNRVTLNDNQAVGGFGGAIMAENIVDRGGNIVAASEVTLSDCTLKNNKAEKVDAITTSGMGGAICIDSGILHLKGNTTVSNNSAFVGGGILVGEEAVLNIQDQATVQQNRAAEGGNGDGICVMSNATPDAAATKTGTLTLKDQAHIAPNNDVTLFPGTVITIAAPYEGASTAQPIHITSYEEAIEALENGTQGTPLVHFSDAAGGAAKALEADQNKHFVSSTYMPNPQGPNAGKMLLIGQSKSQDKAHILTYLGAVQGVTVTFDANTGAWADGSTTQSQRVAASGTLALPENPVKDDKIFNGWNTNPDGTGIAYAPDKPIPAPQVDTVYYAQWKDKDSSGSGGSVTDSVTLHYESNGGTHYKSERYSKNTTVQLDKTPTRDGYTFTGWYADKNLSQKISSIKMTTTKTVYAGWQSDKVPGMLNGKDHFAYIVGYTDGTVKPLNNITRSETATIFFRLLNEDVREAHLTDRCQFDDVLQHHWYNIPVCTMTDLGIIKGRSEDTFAPQAAITRAEFAVICARFDTGVVEEDVHFTDISGHWAEKDIKRAAALGWVEGHPDGSFHPNDYITRAEAAAMINRVLCRQPEHPSDLLTGMIEWPDNSKDAWYYLTMQEATNSHDYILKDDGYEKWTALTNDTK